MCFSECIREQKKTVCRPCGNVLHSLEVHGHRGLRPLILYLKVIPRVSWQNDAWNALLVVRFEALKFWKQVIAGK
jgi:hypothetical protein